MKLRTDPHRPDCCGEPMWRHSHGINPENRSSWVQYHCAHCGAYRRWNELPKETKA